MSTRELPRFAVVAFVGVCIVGLLLGNEVPTWLDAHVRPATDRLYQWTVIHRESFWLFDDIIRPIGSGLKAANSFVLWVLQSLRWTGVVAAFGLVGWRTGGPRISALAVVMMLGCGVLGWWPETLETLALIIVSVVLALCIGIPLGIWAGLSDRADRFLRAFLDTAQVMPAYVYLLPIVVLFGIGIPSAVVATVVFAVPPAVKLTSHGLRSVPVVRNEVGTAYGCTRRQLLMKVQLPSARRTILLGLNQVIMMAFGIVVIAALVGTGGLGIKVLNGLQKVDVGKAFIPGLALVFTAIALDRVTTSERTSSFKEQGVLGRLPRRARVGLLFAFAPIVGLCSKILGVHTFPESWQLDISKPVNSVVTWAQNNLRTGVPIVGGTSDISDWIVLKLLSPLRDLLLAAPWWLVIAAIVAIGWASKGPRLAALCGFCMIAIGALRVWDLAMDTLSQVLVVVLLSVLIAVPIGVAAARSNLIEAILKPLLDAAQVLPTFVYLVPMIALFNVGRVPGVVASIVYALPPCIRLTSLGLREASPTAREAARSFGATSRQELVKVQIPLALRSVMLGINQTIMMALSMVIVAALVGAGALGLETINGLTRSEIGRGLAGGLAIVALAVILDRITQAWGTPAPIKTSRHSTTPKPTMTTIAGPTQGET